MAVPVLLLAVTPPATAALRGCKVSEAQYRALEHGLTLEQVVSRLGCAGHKGVRVSVGQQVRQTYGWRGRGTYGANVNLTFTDGRLTDKSELGLR